jgi:hypothetical protein
MSCRCVDGLVRCVDGHCGGSRGGGSRGGGSRGGSRGVAVVVLVVVVAVVVWQSWLLRLYLILVTRAYLY